MTALKHINHNRISKAQSFLFAGLLFLLILPLGASATHIVGGDLAYRFLEGNQIELTLKVFRDCDNANPEAVFDDPASIGVFDIDGNLLPWVGTGGQFLMYVNPDDTLSRDFDLGCDFDGTPVCVQQVIYKDTFFLPTPREGGYILSYTRCCRNVTIDNIVDPLETGMTFAMYISEFAYERGNSAPEIPDFPINYICKDSMTCGTIFSPDAEGDSVAYFLCTPLGGANSDRPMPQPPPDPTLVPDVVWKPGHDAENPFGALDPGARDSTFVHFFTGDFCLFPEQPGQYLLGLCIFEYADGQLISLYQRDFQFNVRNCGNAPTAIIGADSVYCDGSTTIDFTYDGTNASEYQWYFDATGDTTQQSDEENPTHTYPDTGRYTVVLIASNSPTCHDTAIKEIHITTSGLVADFEPTTDFCLNDSITVLLTNTSTDSIGVGIATAIWTVYIGDDTLTFNGNSVQFSVTEKVEVTVQMMAIDDNGCVASIEKSFTVGAIAYGAPESVVSCVGDTNIIEVEQIDPDIDFDVIWDSSEIIISDLNSKDILIVSDTVGTYILYYTMVTEFGCTVTDSIMVQSDFDVDLDFDYERDCGQLIVRFQNMSDSNSAWLWTFGDGDSSTVYNPVHTYPDYGIYTVVLETFGLCPGRVEKEINLDSFFVDFPDTTISCPGEPIALNPNGNAEYIYTWSPPELFTDTNALNPVLVLDSSVTIMVHIQTVSVDSCEYRDTIFIFVPEDFDIEVSPDDTIFCTPDSVMLTAMTTLPTTITWTNADGDEVGQGENITVIAGESPFYVATGVDSFGCDQSDTANILFDSLVIDFEIVGDPPMVCPNDTIKIVANVSGISDNYSFTWEDDPSIISGLNSDTICVFVTEDATYVVTVFNEDLNCSKTDSFSLQISELEVNISVSGSPPEPICEADTFKLVANVMGKNDDFIFIWEDHPSIIGPRDGDTLCVFLESTHDYRVTVVDTASGCMADAVYTLRYSAVEVSVEILAGELICEGDTVCLAANVTNGGDSLTFVWEPADLIIGDPNNDTICAFVDEDTEFTVTITNSLGCEGSGSASVDVNEIDIVCSIETETGTDTIKEGMIVQLDVDGADPNWTFVWTGGEVSNPNIKNPTAEPREDVTYTVFVTDENGCMDSCTVSVTVIETLCEMPFVFIPNVFTPNGDGENDCWMVRGLPVIEVDIIVYNRWGEKVWETKDKDDCWDGTYRGEQLNDDSYAFYAKIICDEQEELIWKGNVTILAAGRN